MADAKTVVFFPEGAYGPTNNCVGDRPDPPRARPPGGLRDRGVLRREPRGTGVRGAADEARAGAGAGRGAGPVLEGLHPRHRSRLPQADVRPARRVHRTHLRGALRRRALRRRAARRDLRRAPARRHRRGQRRLLPRDPRLGQAVGADRVLQPARAEGSRDRARLLRVPRRRTARAGLPSATSTCGRAPTSTPRSRRSVGSAEPRSSRRASSSTSPTT